MNLKNLQLVKDCHRNNYCSQKRIVGSILRGQRCKIYLLSISRIGSNTSIFSKVRLIKIKDFNYYDLNQIFCFGVGEYNNSFYYEQLFTMSFMTKLVDEILFSSWKFAEEMK
jgi:hypothetical protein